MAVRYEVSGDRLAITQTRRVLRIILWCVVAFGALGIVITSLPKHAENRVDCATGADCAITYGSHAPVHVAGATIDHTKLEQGQLYVVRHDATLQHLCSGTDEELAPIQHDFDAWRAGLHPFHTTCTSTLGGVPLIGKLAGIGGLLFIVVMLGGFVVDTRVVVDRGANTIAMSGARWPMRRWSLERPIADVTSLVVRRVSVGRGQRRPVIYVRFTDGRLVCAWAPMAYRPAELEQRIAELRRFITHA